MAEDRNERETTRDVLTDALILVSDVEEPTPREVLRILIRFECARAGLANPDFDCFPPRDVIGQVLG